MRIGIDLGGTKIAAVALSREGNVLETMRVATPRGDYEGVVSAISNLVAQLEASCTASASVGIAMPGSICPPTGLVQNANSTWMNSKNFQSDIEHALGRDVRLANDANCFALSEACDGAGEQARSVFGVILGTGCGGGFVVDGKLHTGRQNIAGEWGHNPLPWPTSEEFPGPMCWCGRNNCLELWLSGSGLERDHLVETGMALTAHEIAAAARYGDASAKDSLDRHADRLARGLAHVANILDPDVFVIGGGLSQMPHLYDVVPGLMKQHVFSDAPQIDIRPPVHGDASGVRGAARLWN